MTHERRSTASRWTALSLATGAAIPIARKVQRVGVKRIVPPEQLQDIEVALVLGASVKRGLTPVLQDRVHTAAELYRAGRVRRLLLSGSTEVEATGDEVEVMARCAMEAGVPASALVRDERGRHTFESLHNAWRAGHSRLVVVTQRFHLPRALYIAERLGLEAYGVVADRRRYQKQAEYAARELVSSVLAYWMTREAEGR